MITRYAITAWNDRINLRVLAFANQGRHHFDTQAEADGYVAAMLENNPPDVIRQCYGDARLLRVLPVECYDNGDAVRTVFGTEE